MASNIRINPDVHKKLTDHLFTDDRKIGRFTESAIIEKIEKEQKKNTPQKRIHDNNR